LYITYTPKEAHSRIFVTGGSFFARKMLATKKARLGAASLCTFNDGFLRKVNL